MNVHTVYNQYTVPPVSCARPERSQFRQAKDYRNQSGRAQETDRI